VGGKKKGDAPHTLHPWGRGRKRKKLERSGRSGKKVFGLTITTEGRRGKEKSGHCPR